MKLIVLGSSALHPHNIYACSGYLIVAADQNWLIDFGGGSFRNYLNFPEYYPPSGVVITHLHGDHFSDFYYLRYYLKYGERKINFKVPLFLPPGGKKILLSAIADVNNVFEYQESGEEKMNFTGVSLRFKLMPHSLPTIGLVLEAEGKKIGYTADTRYEPSLAEFFSEVDVLIAESTLLEGVKDEDKVGHLSAHDAANLASKAGAKTLVLTHFWPYFSRKDYFQEARAKFEGKIVLAEENMVLEV